MYARIPSARADSSSAISLPAPQGLSMPGLEASVSMAILIASCLWISCAFKFCNGIRSARAAYSRTLDTEAGKVASDRRQEKLF